jgi:hypothetical protein
MSFTSTEIYQMQQGRLPVQLSEVASELDFLYALTRKLKSDTESLNRSLGKMKAESVIKDELLDIAEQREEDHKRIAQQNALDRGELLLKMDALRDENIELLRERLRITEELERWKDGRYKYPSL